MAVELLTGLGEVAEVFGGCVERSGRERFVDRDVDAAQPRSVHPYVSDEIAAGIDDGDVTGLTLRAGFRLFTDEGVVGV